MLAVLTPQSAAIVNMVVEQVDDFLGRRACFTVVAMNLVGHRNFECAALFSYYFTSTGHAHVSSDSF